MYKQYQQSDPFNYHIQYIHYAPYGELIENQHIGSWYDERYKFTGKERDWETGYDYFGAILVARRHMALPRPFVRQVS